MCIFAGKEGMKKERGERREERGERRENTDIKIEGRVHHKKD